MHTKFPVPAYNFKVRGFSTLKIFLSLEKVQKGLNQPDNLARTGPLAWFLVQS